MDPTGADMARLAILPFQVLQAHGLPNAYERSFKMAGGRLLANRYLLGVPGERPSRATAGSIARALAMPASLRDQFLDELEHADGILLGFEAGIEDATLKLYLEYRPSLHGRDRSGVQATCGTEGRLLHQGFKWCVGSEERPRVTFYRERCVKSPRDFLQHFVDLGLQPTTLAVLQALLQQTLDEQALAAMVLSEVSENRTARKGLDLNTYPTLLRVAAIEPALREAAQGLNIDELALHRLMELTRPALLGHLAAGLDAEGRDYLSVYFEP
jgi:hypothetical protein